MKTERLEIMVIPKRPSFCFMLKSYMKDFQYAERLIRSYNNFNVDKIDLYLVVPSEDIAKFSIFKSEVIHILSDKLFSGETIADGTTGMKSGYINQQIIKLEFGSFGVADNWMCLDSDGEFLRNFAYSDFMYNEFTPYTVLVEDNELRVDRAYFKHMWQERMIKIERIAYELNFTDKPILTCHGFQILSQKVISDLKSSYMNPRGLKTADLLAIAEYEFSWYNIWLQKSKAIEIHLREPYFKCFHNQRQHLAYLSQGITRSDISRGYVGMVVNSNFSRDFGVVDYEQRELYELPLRDLCDESIKLILLWLKKVRKLFSKSLLRLVKEYFNK